MLRKKVGHDGRWIPWDPFLRQQKSHPNKKNKSPSEWLYGIFLRGIHNWLVVSTHLKHISQIGNLPQIGVTMKNIWKHHLDNLPHKFSDDSWRVHEGFTQAGGSQLWHRAWKIWKDSCFFFCKGGLGAILDFTSSSCLHLYICTYLYIHTFMYVYIYIHMYIWFVCIIK